MNPHMSVFFCNLGSALLSDEYLVGKKCASFGKSYPYNPQFCKRSLAAPSLVWNTFANLQWIFDKTKKWFWRQDRFRGQKESRFFPIAVVLLYLAFVNALLFKKVHSTRFKLHQKISLLEPALFMFVCLLDLNAVCIHKNMLNLAKFSFVTRLDAKKSDHKIWNNTACIPGNLWEQRMSVLKIEAE